MIKYFFVPHKLWFITFMTFPLLGIEYFRVNIWNFQIPIFILLLYLAVTWDFFTTTTKKRTVFIRFSNTQTVFIVTFLLFIFLHLINMFNSVDITIAFQNQVKLIIAFVVFITLLIFVPRETFFFKKIIDIVIISSTIMLSIYIYRYLFVFNSPVLGLNWFEVSKHGKNQLGLYLSLITPVVLWRYIGGNLLSFWAIPVVMHLFSLLYTGSRGAMISVLISQIIMFIPLIRQEKTKQVFVYFSASFIFIISMFYFFYYSDLFPLKEAFRERILSLYFFSSNPIEGSISQRYELVIRALDIFYENPILGIGTSNFLLSHAVTPTLTHNDYMQVLSEHGFIGITLFLFLSYCIIHTIITLRNNSYISNALKHSALSILIYLNFINAYNLSMLYVIFAFLFIQKELNYKTDFFSNKKHCL